MRVCFNVGQQNSFFNAERVNRSLCTDTSNLKTKSKGEDRDKAEISEKGKIGSKIDSLMKQRQKVIDNKNEFVTKSLSSGKKMDMIRPQLDIYDEQIKNIDIQIAQASTEQLKLEGNKDEKVKDDQPKTKEEVQAQRLNNVVGMSYSMDRAEALVNIRGNLEREERNLEYEIRMSKQTLGPQDSNELIVKKTEELVETKISIENTNSNMGNILNENNKEISDNYEKTENDNIKATEEGNKNKEVLDKLSTEEAVTDTNNSQINENEGLNAMFNE